MLVVKIEIAIQLETKPSIPSVKFTKFIILVKKITTEIKNNKSVNTTIFNSDK